MSLKYGVLSLLLFFVGLLLGFKNYEVWTQPIEWVPENEMVKKSEKKTEIPPMMGGQKEPSSIQSYILVAEKNIFNPERKEFPLVPSGPEAKKSIVRPQIILYGVTISGDYKSSFIVNPGRPLRKGEREMMTLKVGENIGEYKLVKILADRIMMEGAEDSFEVFLYDPKVSKKRSDIRTDIRPAIVTSPPSTPTPTPAEVPKTTPQVTTESPREVVEERITETQSPKPAIPASVPSPYDGRIIRRPNPTRPPTPTGPTGPPGSSSPVSP